MTTIGKDIIPGSSGYDSTTDPALLKPEKCQNLINLLPDRQGILRAATAADTLSINNTGYSIDGIGWYYGVDAYYTSQSGYVAAVPPKLLTASNGTIQFWSETNTSGIASTYPPTFSGPTSTGGVLVVGTRVRFIGYGTEVIAVQDKNIYSTYRITSASQVAALGIATPVSPTVVGQTPTTPSQTITGCTGNAVPIVLTITNHGYAVGQRVWVSGVGGNTNANGFAYISDVTANTFGLYSGGIPPVKQFTVIGGTISVDVRAVPSVCLLTLQGAFANYSFTVGDKLFITSGTNVTTGTYAIAGKISNDTVQLTTNAVSSGSLGTNVYAVPVSTQKAGNANYTSGGTVVPYNKTGLVQYSQTYVDALGRESDLATPVSYDFTANNNDGLITASGLASAVAGGSVVKGYIYATQGGGTTFYRIATLTVTSGDPSFEDNSTSLQVSNYPISAFFGENAPPLAASLGGVHSSRLVLNAGAAGVIQISNQASATQFAVSPQLATDGETVAITADQGNPLRGFSSFGSMLAIALRRGLYILSGDDYTTWYIAKIHDRGCIAPDTFIRADNHVLWLSDDGVYTGSYIYRFQLEKFSKEIEADLQAYNATVAGRALMEAACAAFVNNTYMLAIGNTLYCYDLDTTAWYKLQPFGSTVISSMNVVQQTGTPGILYIGLATGAIAILDRYTANLSVSGIVYRTRLVQPDASADDSARGQTVDTLVARTKRVKVYGSGTISSGTITMTCDGRTESYSIPTSNYPPHPYDQLGVIIYQEFTPAVWGYRRDVTLSLSGTGIVIRSVEIDNEPIG